MTNRHVDEPNYLLEKLMPLRYGVPVRVVQVVKTRHGRLAIERVKNEGILMCPGVLYGLDPGALVVSVIGRGSNVIFPRKGKMRAELIRAGIAPGLVNCLSEALAKVYGERHGTENH